MFLGSPTLLPALLLALALDAGLGDPAWLWQRIPHPVALAGWAIDQLDRALNRDEAPDLHRRIAGSELIIYPDSGHGGIFQYWEQFAPVAATFLSE